MLFTMTLPAFRSIRYVRLRLKRLDFIKCKMKGTAFAVPFLYVTVSGLSSSFQNAWRKPPHLSRQIKMTAEDHFMLSKCMSKTPHTVPFANKKFLAKAPSPVTVHKTDCRRDLPCLKNMRLRVSCKKIDTHNLSLRVSCIFKVLCIHGVAYYCYP